MQKGGPSWAAFRACAGEGRADPARPQGWVGASAADRGHVRECGQGRFQSENVCFPKEVAGAPPSFLTGGSGQSRPPPLWSPGLLGSIPTPPSVLSAGLWEVPATEAVYSGVHPCLERAQRRDGGGEEVHSEVGPPATPRPRPCPPCCPEAGGTGVQGSEHLICEGLLDPPDHMWSEALTCCVSLSQLLNLSGPVSSPGLCD